MARARALRVAGQGKLGLSDIKATLLQASSTAVGMSKDELSFTKRCTTARNDQRQGARVHQLTCTHGATSLCPLHQNAL